MGRNIALVSGHLHLDLLLPEAQPRSSLERVPNQNFQLLKASFSQAFPVPESHSFGDLLEALDADGASSEPPPESP